jgi:hypothetical protein
MPLDLAAMARTLADDGWLPIADRSFAAEIAHRRRLQLRVERRADLARLLALYDQPPRAA